MSTIILRTELVGARKPFSSCPRGIAGRVHTLRLRRHFHRNLGLQLIAIGTSEFIQGDHSHAQKANGTHTQFGQEQRLSDGVVPDWSEQVSAVHTLREAKDSKAGFARELSRRKSTILSRSFSFDSDMYGMEFPPWRHVPGLSNHPVFTRDEQMERFYHHLKAGDSHSVLRELLKSLTTVGPASSIIRDLPPNTFSDVLRSLNPDIFIGRQLQSRQEISPTHPIYAGLKLHNAKTGYYHICNVFMHRIQTIVETRRANGFSLSLVDYSHLLRCARIVGNQKAMENLWNQMRKEAILPDTECYNHYMASKVWSDSLNPVQRFHLRVTPYSRERRTNHVDGTRKPKAVSYQGHSVGVGGVKFETTRLFNQMVQNGSLGDEETFCLMMVAFGREGDIESLQSILNRVWGLDVPALMALEERSLSPMRHFAPGSPLRPSNSLLLTIAHVYGINNQIQPALHLIDYVSRQNSLGISISVWQELLNRTFILSCVRSSMARVHGDGIGQLPLRAVIDVWDVMTAEPYNVSPTMSMYDKVIMTLTRMRKFPRAQQIIEEGRGKHIHVVNQYRASLSLWDKQEASFHHQTSIDRFYANGVAGCLASQQLVEVKRQVANDYIIMHRSRQYVRKWCRQFIREGTLHHPDPEFHTRGLQAFQESLHLFLPHRVVYDTTTGHVKFWTGSSHTNKARAKSYLQQRYPQRFFY